MMRIEWRTPMAMLALCAVLPMAALAPAYAARSSDIRNTVHNLSATGPGTVKAAGESQVCVFCHTPHGADTSEKPLWNKTLAAKTYTVYTSKSLDAETILNASLDQPLGSSKLCLSCHDGAMALGSVRVLRGVNNPATISVANTGTGGIMPGGSGTTTGYTKNLGAGTLGQTTGFDLTNDHPISVTYTDTLAARDGEMRAPDVNQNSTIMVGGTHPLFGKRAAGQGANRPVLPLDPTGPAGAGQVQCTTCHDPHIKGDATDITNELNIKFLRRPRFQSVQPTNAYADGTDIICLACHDKGLQGAGGATWAYSAHANSNVATQLYRSGVGSAAAIRQFPTNIPVWKAACLNCHDTHTVTGARRLLREGNDATPATALSAGGFKAGGASAIEQTCYQCHRDAAGSILASSTSVPNIMTDFALTYRMPITSADQDAAGVEMHDPGSGRTGFNDGFAGGVVNGSATSGSNCSAGINTKCGADLVESRALTGTTATNRHVECTDCHNPHRVVKNRLFYGSVSNTYNIITPQTEGTHEHTDTAMTHTNVASGVLRGGWGVEPIYTNSAAGRSFHTSASNYTVRRGDPGSEVVTNAMPLTNANMDTKGFLTREYQVCLKCHSTYGYTTPPNLRTSGSQRGLTPAGSVATPGVGNALTQYTDQAKEFQAPDNHADESDGTTAINLGTEAGAIGYNGNNHRSWHPVMRSTGRTESKRSVTATSAWRAPFSNAVGTQTMYCTDCHGSNVTSGTSVIPDNTVPATGAGNAWGPHGSANPFILKGTWDKDSSSSSAPLCLKCHSPTSSSAFDGGGKGNLHAYHNTKTGPIQCTWCHIAVPHGWKNKSLLVNLNDVGEEVGLGAGSSNEVAIGGSNNFYTKAPYYLEAKNKIRTFQRPGQWADSSCGSSTLGVPVIANSQGSTSNLTGSGKNWMTDMCQNPP
jgi:hypothetical protein